MRVNLDKAYARFTPDERLALLVESAARRDHAEADRLWQTAPMVSMQGVHPTVSLCFLAGCGGLGGEYAREHTQSHAITVSKQWRKQNRCKT